MASLATIASTCTLLHTLRIPVSLLPIGMPASQEFAALWEALSENVSKMLMLLPSHFHLPPTHSSLLTCVGHSQGLPRIYNQGNSLLTLPKKPILILPHLWPLQLLPQCHEKTISASLSQLLKFAITNFSPCPRIVRAGFTCYQELNVRHEWYH